MTEQSVDHYLIVVGDIKNGDKNLQLKELYETFLPSIEFKRLEDEIPYLYGYLEINLTQRTFQSRAQLSDPVQGPVFYFEESDSSRIRILNSIRHYILYPDKRKGILNKLNEKIVIEFFPCLNGSPCFQFAVRGYADFTNPDLDQLTIKGDNMLIAAKNEQTGEYVGVIIFEKQDNGCYKNIYIVKSYVHKEYRNQGVWTKMWNRLVEMAKENGNIKNIWSRVHISNKIMQQTGESVGREAVSYNYKYKI